MEVGIDVKTLDQGSCSITTYNVLGEAGWNALILVNPRLRDTSEGAFATLDRTQ